MYLPPARWMLIFFCVCSMNASWLVAADGARRDVGVKDIAGKDDKDPGKAFFEGKIRPMLVKHCYECHSNQEDKLEGGLGVDTRKAMRTGGDRGPAVVPNDVARSLVISAIKYAEEDLQMPPDGKLDDSVIADFVEWIELGAPDPREDKKKR